MFKIWTHSHSFISSLLQVKRSFIIFGIAVLLSACQSTPNEVKTASNSGFGGTGKTLQEPTQMAKESGFGGTGQVASKSGFGGTGIIGTITEFGSIWVNGVEVEYDQNVKVTSNVSANPTLELGQQVIVETSHSHKQPWTDTIQIFYPLAGLVEKVEPNKLVVDGQSVFINKQTQITKGLEVKVGSMIAVNGYPDENNIWTATRLGLNTGNKHIYQLTPDISFSKFVTKLIIETHKSQLANWNKAFSGLNVNVISNPESKTVPQKYVLKADLSNGKITGYHLHDYYRVVKNQKAISGSEFSPNASQNGAKGNPIKKPPEPLKTKEAHNTFKENKAVFQNQLQQMKQFQDIKDNLQKF